MKMSKQQIGLRGEQIAVEFLAREGYQILERNWRYRRTEIDIIAKFKEILIFLEVKTLQSEAHGRPERNITKRKMALLLDGASIYMERANHLGEIRFDVISIILTATDSFKITHFIDAYWPDAQ